MFPGMFYAIKNGEMFPFYNDAQEGFQEKLRLEKDLNEVRIGHWKSHDDEEEYYSPVSNSITVIVWKKINIDMLNIFTQFKNTSTCTLHPKIFSILGKHDCVN